MTASNSEAQIQADIMAALAGRRDLRIWRASAGAARDASSGRVYHFGTPGQADLSGILADGRRLEIEAKTKTGRQSDQQKAFQAMIERFGGVYILARSVQDVLDVLGPGPEGAR